MVMKRAYVTLHREDLNVETFQRTLLYMWHVSTSRPHNVSPPTSDEADDMDELSWEKMPSDVRVSDKFLSRLVSKMMECLWKFLDEKPRHRTLSPPCIPGLTQIDITVRVIVDILHSVTASSIDMCGEIADVYYKLLSHENPAISYSTKSTLTKLLGSAKKVTRGDEKSEEDDKFSRSSSPVSVASTNIEHNSGETSVQHGSHVSSARDTTAATLGGDEMNFDVVDTMEDDDEDDLDDDDDDDDDDDMEEEDDFPDIEEGSLNSEEREFIAANDPIYYGVCDYLRFKKKTFFKT